MIPLRDTIPASRFPVITTCIIGVNVLVFLFEISLSDRALNAFFYTWGIIPYQFTHARLTPNYLTVLSSIFLHGGWMHMIGNMWSLWIFGDNVEDRMGRRGFVMFYLLSGVAAGALHILTNPGSRVPTVGASGAIAGVMGAYLWLFPQATVVTLVPIFVFLQIVELPAILFLGLWFVSNLFSGLGSLAAQSDAGGIAWWAHIGGFLVGILWAMSMRRHQLSYHQRSRYEMHDDRW